MAGKRNSVRANQQIEADEQLAKEFADLNRALESWLDGGSYEEIALAIKNVAERPTWSPEFGPEQFLPRDQRVIDIARELGRVSAAKVHIDRAQGSIQARFDYLTSKLITTAAEASAVPGFVKGLWGHMKALGAIQNDLHPPSKKLASAMLTAAREYNFDRVGMVTPSGLKIPPPVTRWTDLPRSIGGYELIDVEPDPNDFDPPLELPPSTRITYFTEDRQMPHVYDDHLQVIGSWIEIIKSWAARNGIPDNSHRDAVWALLLSHRWPKGSKVKPYFETHELQSPWGGGKVAKFRIVV